mgnify:CR=1 FL=1
MGEEFVVVGEGDPSMVLLPGWATDGRIFEGVLPGVTAVTTGPLRPDRFSRRLAAFLDRTARGPVTVVGWSLGGFLAAEFAPKVRVNAIEVGGVATTTMSSSDSIASSMLRYDRSTACACCCAASARRPRMESWPPGDCSPCWAGIAISSPITRRRPCRLFVCWIFFPNIRW